MTTVNLSIAEAIFTETREFYQSGYRSGNKRFDMKTLYGKYDYEDIKVLSAIQYNTESKEADKLLVSLRADASFLRNSKKDKERNIIKQGSILYNKKKIEAANCDELACVSFYFATKKGIEPSQLRFLAITRPGDHGFCLCGDVEDIRIFPEGVPVKSLEELKQFTNTVFAIDAWLNIYCPIDKYPKRAANKMKEWLRRGKRIHWPHAAQGAGWYPPARGKGEYATAFLNANYVLRDPKPTV